jgi:hypothetical protein
MTDVARHSLATAIAHAADYLAARYDVAEIKTIGQITKRYGDQLSNLVYDIFNGNSDPIDFRRAHKALLREVAPSMYLEGLNEGGIKEADIDEDDQAAMDETVNDWLGAQLSFVNDFAKAIGDAKKDKTQRPAILDRVAQWVDSLRTLGDLGRAYATRNEKGRWVLGDTEHCDTCLRLSKMAPKRLSWFTDRGYIPRENGSETLDCHGFNCQCEIQNAKGKVLL